MPSDVHYPDIDIPRGWSAGRQELQVRLVPPGTSLDDALVVIVLSPLVPRQPLLPPPETLIEAAIQTEARRRLEVVSQTGPTPIRSDFGLTGVAYDVIGYPRPHWPQERRIYAMYSDSLCYYAISYLAREDAFAEHIELFWSTARSIRPFRGRIVHPTATSPVASLYAE